jgi:ABC-type transporter Mla MlaB component
MDTGRSHSVAFSIRGPITRADLPGLCARVSKKLDGCSGRIVRCDVSAVEPDAVAIDALARLQLVAQRRGCRVRLCNASTPLLDLVAFMGLGNVLPCDGPRPPERTAPP